MTTSLSEIEIVKWSEKKDVPHVDDNCWWFSQKGIATSFLCIAVFACLMRVAVSLFPYSGFGDSPKFGDYEAQRHWMEITLSLPAKDWYKNSTDNDLTYWGLDYPPLTAFQSYVHGLLLRHFHPDSVSLFSSRGHESYLGKLIMRLTVLSSDVLVFFPAALYFVVVYYAQFSTHKCDIAWHIAMILVNPCLILIDHGHFQYNCISLGLTIGAIAAILSDRELAASFLFSLALNHKQMSAYYAPAFFSHLLGKCLRRKNPFLKVLKLGSVVLATFIILWWPYLDSVDSILRVFTRLAPFERGIYEDYVANFWCTTSIIIKWKKLLSTHTLKLISFTITLCACLPSMAHQLWTPTNQGFIYGLLNTSFSFYLFSYQVHEKSILLPLLPATLLALKEPLLLRTMTHFAMVSMFPLLCRDKLVVPYIALFTLFTLLYNLPAGNQNARNLHCYPTLISLSTILFVSCSLILHMAYLFIPPPEKYPFLFEALIMLLCFSQFVLLFVYANIKQWMLTGSFVLMDESKKLP